MSALFLGIAVRFLIPPGGLTAWGNVKLGSRSGFSLSMRYRVQKLVSTLSCMRFVSRFFPEDPVAVLHGNVRIRCPGFLRVPSIVSIDRSQGFRPRPGTAGLQHRLWSGCRFYLHFYCYPPAAPWLWSSIVHWLAIRLRRPC